MIRPLAWLLPGHVFPYVFCVLSFKSSNALLFVGLSSHLFLYLLQMLTVALGTLELKSIPEHPWVATIITGQISSTFSNRELQN